jgi:hypothetical protein
MGGSIWFKQTWRQKATPAGRSYWAHTASAHRISDSGCGSSQRPEAQEDGSTLEQYQARRLRGYDNRKGKTSGGPASEQGGLAIAAQLASWPTPNTPSGGRTAAGMDATGRMPDGTKHTVSLEHVAKFAGWPTATKQDSVSSGVKGYAATASHHTGTTLTDAARMATAGASGAMPNTSHAQTASGGQLNPSLSRWLMGYSQIWDVCAMAIPSSRTRSRKGPKIE